jgi:PKD repeat protein
MRFPQHFAGVVNILGPGTFIEGAPDGMPIHGPYSRPVTEQVTGTAAAPEPEVTIDFTIAESADQMTFAFTASSSATDPVGYEWNFGEGTSGDGHIDAVGQSVTHTFTSPGPRNITVTARRTADSRLMRSTVKTIQVGAAAPPPPPDQPPPSGGGGGGTTPPPTGGTGHLLPDPALLPAPNLLPE